MLGTYRGTGSQFKLESISLTVVEAKNIKNTDMIGKADHYVIASIGANNKATTKVLKSSGSNPKWNEKLQLKAVSAKDTELIIELMDKDTFTKDDFIDSVKIPFNTSSRGNVDQFFPLKDKSGKPNGEIRISILPSGSMVGGSNPPVAMAGGSLDDEEDHKHRISKLKNKIKEKMDKDHDDPLSGSFLKPEKQSSSSGFSEKSGKEVGKIIAEMINQE